MPENTQTLACDLAALPPGSRKRLKELSEELFRSVDELREMPEGFDLGFSEGSTLTIEKIAEFIALDRLCCPFIRHGLIHEPYERGVWLHLSGAAGVKDIIKSDLLGSFVTALRLSYPLKEHDPDTTS
jgi:hypothetical protein